MAQRLSLERSQAAPATEHEIADYGGGAWQSVDSSYILLDPATRTATLPGGIKLIFGNSIASTSYLT